MGFFSDIASVAAPIAGAAIGSSFGNPMLGAQIGGMLGGAVAGGQQVNQANQQLQQAAQMSQFRPVGVTNTFGTSNFQYDPKTGQMTSAGYSLSPQLQSAQNALMGGLGTTLQDQANIQAMGRQYMAQSPQEQAQQYMANQQALLAPSREQQWSGLGVKNFNQGTTGLKVAQGGDLQSANPYASALANAQAMQDLQLAADATKAGQQQYQFGQGLLSSAYQPYTAGLTAAGATEKLGQNAYDLSTALGGQVQKGATTAADYLTQQQNPYLTAANSLLSNQQLLSGIGNIFGNNTPASSDVSGLGLGGYGTNANYGFGTGTTYTMPSTGSSYGLQATGGLGLTNPWSK